MQIFSLKKLFFLYNIFILANIEIKNDRNRRLCKEVKRILNKK